MHYVTYCARVTASQIHIVIFWLWQKRERIKSTLNCFQPFFAFMSLRLRPNIDHIILWSFVIKKKNFWWGYPRRKHINQCVIALGYEGLAMTNLNLPQLLKFNIVIGRVTFTTIRWHLMWIFFIIIYMPKLCGNWTVYYLFSLQKC